MNTVFGILILVTWTCLVMSISWDSKSSVPVNLFTNLFLVGLLGIVYWLPFWLLFLK